MATLKEKKRKLKKMRARNIILNMVCMFGCLRALVDYYLFLALH